MIGGCKKISKTVKSRNNQAANSNSKVEVQGAMLEVQGAMIECNNKFSCRLISFDRIEKGKQPNDSTATSLSSGHGKKETPLRSRNVWIGDSRESKHLTFSPIAGINKLTCKVWMIDQILMNTKQVDVPK